MTKKENAIMLEKLSVIRAEALSEGYEKGIKFERDRINKANSQQKIEAINRMISNLGQTVVEFNKLIAS